MKKKKLITSALPYVNNVPHLGNIIGCVLSADVYARFCRSAGYETLYVCATDEYGTATENKAREEGVSPREICDRYHAIHAEVYRFFNISFDFFGRTSHPEHTEVTQSVFRDLEANDMILEKESEQTYCEHDQMFLADRYVAGTCPGCGYEMARGDQCDSCGKLLQTTELIDPKCQVCGNPPVSRRTRHLYIDLEKLQGELKDFQKTSSQKGNWSSNAISVTLGWLERGLVSRPITRDLSWGVPVPKEGFENKVFYVWFDAPIGYISATKRACPDEWEDWWLNPDETELYQFMAKDNIPFHTVVFPACLLGTRKPWTMLHHISSTEYLNYENDKFSKSRKIGVFGTDVIEMGIDPDLWRFYLLYNRPEKSDSNFLWDSFFEDINSNFIDNIGNLLNRVLVFYHKNFDPAGIIDEIDKEHRVFFDAVQEEALEATGFLEKAQIREALKAVLALGKRGNKFFQDLQPWSLIKTDQEKTRSGLVVLLYLIRDLGLLLEPYMPATSKRILAMVGCEEMTLLDQGNDKTFSGKVLSPPELLFKKLEKKQIDQLKSRFSGTQGPEKPDPLLAWSRVLLKVGEIIAVEKHPSADRLYVESIDLGEERPRTIVSGLVAHYQPEELLGKKVLVVANLEPADLRGVRSEGMLLAAEKKKKLEVLALEAVKNGTIAEISGIVSDPLDRMTIDQFFQADLKVVDHQVMISERPLMVAGNAVLTQSISNGKVS
ncbi:MAG: methionine--tRNA ligase [Deltaproteobacteria bacterium]|nr:methionine--tRNA ligase [Deltaproteobacteria bacterium]